MNSLKPSCTPSPPSWGALAGNCGPPIETVYSCGAFLHDGLVWIPYGIDDCRIGVTYAPPGEVLAGMSSAS
jgi:predicted GH43/DUF377 family glycosyl hydrolase